MDGLLKSHRIDPEPLRADDFYSFYERRRIELLALISSVIGKRINNTVDEISDEDDEIIEDEEP